MPPDFDLFVQTDVAAELAGTFRGTIVEFSTGPDSFAIRVRMNVELEEVSITGARWWFHVPITHPNYNAMFSTAMVAAVNRLTVEGHWERDVPNASQHAISIAFAPGLKSVVA